MKNLVRLHSQVLGCFALLVLVFAGCTQEGAVDQMKKAESSTEKAMDAASKEVGGVVKEGSKNFDAAMKKSQAAAAELGDKAMGYLRPLKEKFGSLESLKETPEKLKMAVEELVQSIEGKAKGIELPETMSKALESLKAKLVALKVYLEGKVEQAKVDEHIRDIMDSVKSGLGM